MRRVRAAGVPRSRGEPVLRFGATMTVDAATTYLKAGMAGILAGQDTLDSVLMVFLISGTYLASGRQALLVEDQAIPSATRQLSRPRQ